MKNMKKMVAFGMTAILGVSMLAGCGSSQKETEAPKTEAATEKKTEVSGMKIRDLQWKN